MTPWQVLDQFEDRARDKENNGPLARYIWRQAFEDLKEALGERKL